MVRRKSAAGSSRSPTGEDGVILLIGASGFLGHHLVPALLGAGYSTVCAIRHVPPTTQNVPRSSLRYPPVDFQRDLQAVVWRPRLVGINVVINAVGIIREEGGQRFDVLHVRTP